jgi:hypothetical protein
MTEKYHSVKIARELSERQAARQPDIAEDDSADK